MHRTPEQHAEEAERLLDLADDYVPGRGHTHGLLLKANAHATLSLRKPAPKKRTTSTRKESDA